jgi:hypothetical protein
MNLITVTCPECRHPHYITEDYLECCILTCNCHGGEGGESITAMSMKVAEYLNNTERKTLLEQMKNILSEEEYKIYETDSLYKQNDQLPQHMTISMAEGLKNIGITMIPFIIKKNENNEYIAEKHHFIPDY